MEVIIHVYVAVTVCRHGNICFTGLQHFCMETENINRGEW